MLSLLEKVLNNIAALSSYEETHVSVCEFHLEGVRLASLQSVYQKYEEYKDSKGEVLSVMCVQSMDKSRRAEA